MTTTHDGARPAGARPSAAALPTGTVTFLFADIEGSTRLARSLAPETWAALLARHDRLVDGAVAAHRGQVVKHEGDGTFAAFGAADDAAAAAVAISAAIAGEPWPGEAAVRLRVGLHTGIGSVTGDGRDYVGVDVHYAARLAAAGNGGQIVVSDATARALGGRLPGDASIVRVGPRRLKDFDEPRDVHRLIVPGAADDDRPLRTLGGSDVPDFLTSFIGRDEEVGRVAGLLGTSRLVTLTGPGGTGKTRLAASIAEAVRSSFPDGVAFVELSPVRDPDVLPTMVAAAIGIAPGAGVSLMDALRAALAARRMLLVLDNVEQLLPGAATIITALLGDAPGLRVLVASREPLRVRGEQEYAVPPLGLGDAEALFVDRARLVAPGFELGDEDRPAVEAIIRRVGGLPLAIELAAARTKLFGPREISSRLDRSFDLLAARSVDVPERQRSLRATIGWSHDLLAPADQVLFRRLAVFVGDWTADVAARVAAGDGAAGPAALDEADVLDGLASLVDKSLLTAVPSERGETRFGWHVFVREYAAERLAEAGELDDCARRHAIVFRELATAVGPHLIEAAAEVDLALLDRAIHDLRAAMTWSIAAGEPEVGLRIVGSAWRWWQLRLNLREGRDWAARLLAVAEAGDSIGRMEALAAAGGLAYWSGDVAATREAYEERLAIAERIGSPAERAEAHYDLGFVGMVMQDVALLRHEEEQALELFEAVGDEPSVIRTRQALVLAHYLAGDPAAALELEHANLAAFRRVGASYRVADSLQLMAAISRLANDPDGARLHAREAIRSMSQRWGGATLGALGIIAIVEGESGDAELAARLTGAIRAIQAETGEALAPVNVLHLPEPETILLDRLSPERARELIAEGARLTPEAAIELALGEARPTPEEDSSH